jgi:hypothetical protein
LNYEGLACESSNKTEDPPVETVNINERPVFRASAKASLKTNAHEPRAQ